MSNYKPKSRSPECTESEGAKGSRKIDGLRKVGLDADVISKPQRKKRTLNSPVGSPCHRPAIPATTGSAAETGCKHVYSPPPKHKLKDIWQIPLYA